MFLRESLARVRDGVYAGHHADGSSIQKHSAGSAYPFIMRVREDVPNGMGYAEVIDSLCTVRFSKPYPLSNKLARLAAYGAALDAADHLAIAKRAVQA